MAFAAEPGVVAGVVTAVVGALGVLAGRLIPSHKEKNDEQRTWREELRADMDSTRKQVREMEGELSLHRRCILLMQDRYFQMALRVERSQEQIDELKNAAGLPITPHPPIPPIPFIEDGRIVELTVGQLVLREQERHAGEGGGI